MLGWKHLQINVPQTEMVVCRVDGVLRRTEAQTREFNLNADCAKSRDMIGSHDDCGRHEKEEIVKSGRQNVHR